MEKVRLKPGPKVRFTAEEIRLRRIASSQAWNAKNKRARDEYGRYHKAGEAIAKPWKRLINGAKNRASEREIPFALTYEWGESIWTGRCSVTGIEFKSNRGMGSGPGPFSPSIDRLIPELGYVPGNCRFILHAINAMRSSGSDDDAFLIAKAFVQAEIVRRCSQ